MGRRVKSIVALLVVLGLLYWQQDQISYATEIEKTESQVELFEAEISKPDGENGYYRSWPAVKIRHISQVGVTHCRLVNSEGQTLEKILDQEGEEAVFEQEEFCEGNNELAVWMTDGNGEVVEGYCLEQSFEIDMTGPVISLSVPRGMDVWYGEEVLLSVAVEDGQPGSQPAEVVCSIQGETIGRTDRKNAVFAIRQVSQGGAPVKVQVKAVDRAGNVSWQECELLIDGKVPEAVMEGVPDYMISSQPVKIRLMAREENVLAGVYGKVVRETPDGAVREDDIKEWSEAGDGTQAWLTLEEDGIYQVAMEVQDGAGHTASDDRKLIIDRTNPMIQYVDALNGTYQKSFCLDNKKGDLIKDFTSFTYTATLDGRLYPLGETVDREGIHFLEVKAVDAAGNMGTASAEFVIDHTAPKVVFRNLEDGGRYEEQKTFQITLEDPQDEICEVRINGIRQKTNGHSKIYQYTVEEERNYEVSVTALDRAGNKTIERMTFDVVEKETLAEQIINPIKKTLGIEDNRKEKRQERKETTGTYGLLGIGVLLVAAGGTGWMLWRKKKNKSNPVK